MSIRCVCKRCSSCLGLNVCAGDHALALLVFAVIGDC